MPSTLLWDVGGLDPDNHTVKIKSIGNVMLPYDDANNLGHIMLILQI